MLRIFEEENEREERIPLLSVPQVIPRSVVADLRYLGMGIPVDCWSQILSYIFEKQMSVVNIQQALLLAHTNSLLRSVVVSVLKGDRRQIFERVSSDHLICIAEHDSDELHKELAEICLLYPTKLRAAKLLSKEANDAGSAALRILVQIRDFVQDMLFYPTVLAIIDVVHFSWRVWTVSAAGILFIPLFVLGWYVCSATLKWWFSLNPVALCPHVNRHYIIHAINPTPWFRIVVLMSSTIFISFLIATAAWRVGTWLDTLPQTETDWILVLILLFVYT